MQTTFDQITLCTSECHLLVHLHVRKRWEYPAKNTACLSDARFYRYKRLKSVTVGSGRAAQYKKQIPLVDDELARPSAYRSSYCTDLLYFSLSSAFCAVATEVKKIT